MIYSIACATRYLKLLPNREPYSFGDFSIIPSQEALDEGFFEESVIKHIGLIVAKTFINSPIIYGKRNLDDSFGLANVGLETLNLFSKIFGLTWLAKDNSVNIGATLAKDDRYINFATSGGIYSNLMGEFDEVELSDSDFDLALKALSIINKIEKPFKVNYLDPLFREGRLTPPPNAYKLHNDNSRVERAFDFLLLARSNEYLTFKIAFFTGIFECLFTTDKIEVAHKVSERAAVYLGETQQERISIYRLLNKDAYSIRSSFFHGQHLNKKFAKRDDLIDVLRALDKLTRKLLLKVLFEDLENFSKPDEELTKWFNEKLFQ